MNIIHKRMLKKDVNDKKMNYEALAPAGEIKNGKEYFYALDWALNNDDIRNIAVSGPYGSGKSSVIASYFNQKKNKKVLKISLAAFNLEAVANHANDEIEKEKLEAGILKQLFYSVGAERIPRSRYKKLQVESSGKSMGQALYAMIVLYVALYYIFYERTQLVLGSIVSLTKGFFWCYCLGFCGVTWYVLFRFLDWFNRNGNIQELKILDNKMSIIDNKDTAFNKNLDEIVYFFEKTKKTIVVFEDLDRFESSNIFVSLRDLNYILNNYERIKRPIKFIYATKDDMFLEKGERTKFFDFIIPIVPYISSTNSGEILRDKLQIDAEKNISSIYEISGNFISFISPYINDMRDLICICNEFNLYKNTLQNNQDLRLNDEKMFALMVFKNLYPRDFAELENEASNSIILRVFANKGHFIEYGASGIKVKQKADGDKIKELQRECIQSIKELKICLLDSLTGYQSPVHYINDGLKQINISDFLSDSFDVNSLKGRKLQIYHGTTSKIIKDIEEYDKNHGNYYARMDIITENQSRSIERLRKAIEEDEQRIKGLRSYTIKQLIEEFGTDFLDQSSCENDLLVFLLRNGYLDEDYGNYINYFHPNSITKEEKNFILGVRNHRAVASDYAYSLNHLEQIFNQLQDCEFRQKDILNFDLVDYVLSAQEGTLSANMLMDNLSDHSKESMNFIKAYIDRKVNIDIFMQCLCKRNRSFWSDVEQDEGISCETKFDYLVLMLKYVNMNDIILQDKENGNESRPLSQFMLSHVDSLKGIASAPIDKQVQLIRELDLSFNDVELNSIDELVKSEIFDNWRYDLNEVMLCRVFEWKAPDLVEIQKKKNYSSILQLGNQELLDYVHEYFEEYIEQIVLGMDGNKEEDICAIEDIFERLMPDQKDLCFKVLEKECTIWEDIKKCCADFKSEWKETKQKIWDYLLDNERIQCSFDNFVDYYYEFGRTKTWEKYLDNHIDSMVNQIDNYELSNDFIDDLIQADISMLSFRKLLTKIEINPYGGELIGLNEEKIGIMIEERALPFEIPCWEDMKCVAPKYRVKYAESYKDEFFQTLDELKFSENEVNEMLISKVFNNKEKGRLVRILDAKELSLQSAVTISSLKFLVEKKYAMAAWMILDAEKKKELLIYQVDNYNDAELSKLFLELSGEYRSLSERTNHTVKLEITDFNRKLLEKLKSRGYITSYREDVQRINKEKEERKLFSVKVKNATPVN